MKRYQIQALMAIAIDNNCERDRSQDEWIIEDTGWMRDDVDPIEFAKARHPKAFKYIACLLEQWSYTPIYK